MLRAENVFLLKSTQTKLFLTFYVMKVFGSWPYRINSKNFACPEKKIFSTCLVGFLVGHVFLIINLLVVYDNLEFTTTQFKIHKSCLAEVCFGPICRNLCAHLVIIWMIDLQNVTSILNLLYHRKLRTLNILNKSVRMAAIFKLDLPLASTSVIFFVAVQVCAFIFQWSRAYFAQWYFDEFLLTYLAMSCTLAANNLISLCLLIMEYSHKEITRQLGALSNVAVTRTVLISTQNLQRLRLLHWQVTSIIKHISSCFAFDMLIESVTSAVRVIYFMFLMLKFLTDAFYNPSKSSTFSVFQSIVFLISVVGKFVYLCYRCNRVVQEEENSLISINRLLLKARSHKDTQAVSMLSDFLEQAKVRQISFSACGLFTLNLRLVCTIFGITMTYFIVLVQFKTAAQSPKT